MSDVLMTDAPALTPDEQWRRWIERYTWHLDQVPGLLEVMRGEVPRISSDSARYGAERISSSRDGAPVPFRVDVMDSIDELWAALVLYAENVAELLGTTAPLVDRWRVRSDVGGLKPSTDARRESFTIVAWLVDRIDAIAPLEQLGDSEDHLFRLIRSLRARYVSRPVRHARPRPCSLCGEGEVVVRFADDGSPKGVRVARCDVCGEEFA